MSDTLGNQILDVVGCSARDAGVDAARMEALQQTKRLKTDDAGPSSHPRCVFSSSACLAPQPSLKLGVVYHIGCACAMV